jgi:hypothetical protein
MLLLVGLMCSCSIEGGDPDSQKATIVISSHITPTVYKINIYINFQHYEITDLIKNADIIGIGEITEKYPSQWTTNDGKAPDFDKIPAHHLSITIISDMQFKISDIYKGINDSVRIRTIGGRVDNSELICDATPELELKDKYLLFLIENDTATKDVYPINYMIVGGFQGAFLITDELAIQEKTGESWELEQILILIEKTINKTIEI